MKTQTYLEITETGSQQLWTLSHAIRHPSFWMVCLATFCTPMAAYTIVLHQVAFVVDSGFEPMYAASVLGFVGLFAMIGRIAGGGLSDTIGREWSYSIFTGSAALAVVFLFLLNPARPWILMIYVVLMGLGMGVGSGLLPAIIADLFPGPSFGRIMGISMIFGGLGASFGSWFAGFLHDITGSYTGGLFLVLLSNVGAITFIWIAAPRRARRIYTRYQK
jgi:MFS family permease